MTCTTTHHPGCDCHEARRDAQLTAAQQALREREAEVADLKHLLDARQMVVERFQMMRDELAIQVDEKNTTIREQAERIERLEKVYLAAFGLCFGEDWNKGNHAIKHGYRQRLRNAVSAIEEHDTRQALSPAPEAGK